MPIMNSSIGQIECFVLNLKSPLIENLNSIDDSIIHKICTSSWLISWLSFSLSLTHLRFDFAVSYITPSSILWWLKNISRLNSFDYSLVYPIALLLGFTWLGAAQRLRPLLPPHFLLLYFISCNAIIMRLEHMHVHHAPTEREKRNAHVFSSLLFNCVAHTCTQHTHGWSARLLSSFIFWNSSSFIPPARPRLHTPSHSNHPFRSRHSSTQPAVYSLHVCIPFADIFISFPPYYFSF